MDAAKYNETLIEILEEQLAAGLEQASTAALIGYLRGNSNQLIGETSVPFEASLEEYKAKLQKWNEDHKSHNAQSLELIRAAISSGQNALRTSFLMNGGASVAILAFIGHLAAVDSTRIPDFAQSLTWFVSGVFAIGAASGATYASQWLFSDWDNGKWTRRWGNFFNLLAVSLGLISYGLFIKGMISSYEVLSNYNM